HRHLQLPRQQLAGPQARLREGHRQRPPRRRELAGDTQGVERRNLRREAHPYRGQWSVKTELGASSRLAEAQPILRRRSRDPRERIGDLMTGNYVWTPTLDVVERANVSR